MSDSREKYTGNSIIASDIEEFEIKDNYGEDSFIPSEVAIGMHAYDGNVDSLVIDFRNCKNYKSQLNIGDMQFLIDIECAHFIANSILKMCNYLSALKNQKENNIE